MRPIGIIIALLSLVSPAAAQPSTTGRVTAEGLRELHDYSRCVVLGGAGRVQEVLAMDGRTPEYAEAMGRLIQQRNTCTQGRLAAGGILFAGALAERMIERQLGGRGLGIATAHVPSRPPLQARDATDFMAICLVRTQPDKVAVLFATVPGSVEEERAVSAMQADLPGCMPAGQTVRFNRPALRAVLAWASFRLINHNAAPATAAVEN